MASYRLGIERACDGYRRCRADVEDRVPQVTIKGKNMQAQMTRHTIRNSISRERKQSQPITIILDVAPSPSLIVEYCTRE